MKSKKNVCFSICLLVLFLCYSCSKTPIQTKAENFNSFYLKFFSDSIFQKSRTIFPFPEYDTNQDFIPDDILIAQGKKRDTTFIDKSRWRFMKTISKSDSTYKVAIKKTDSLVTEEIYIPNSDCSSTATFRLKRDGKWYLTFYQY